MAFVTYQICRRWSFVYRTFTEFHESITVQLYIAVYELLHSTWNNMDIYDQRFQQKSKTKCIYTLCLDAQSVLKPIFFNHTYILMNHPDISGGRSVRRSGDLLFVQKPVKERCYTTSNRPQKSIFGHDCHPLADFLNPSSQMTNQRTTRRKKKMEVMGQRQHHYLTMLKRKTFSELLKCKNQMLNLI